MKDPELRGPHEWADELRDRALTIEDGDSYPCDREMSPVDHRELADRMDDLTEAIGLLRSVFQIPGWTERAKELLAKYEEE